MEVDSALLIQLRKQSDKIIEYALYLDKVSDEMSRYAISIKNILDSTEKAVDLPLEFL